MGYQKDRYDTYAKLLNNWTLIASSFAAVSGLIFTGLAFDVVPETPLTEDQLGLLGMATFSGLLVSVLFIAMSEVSMNTHKKLGEQYPSQW